MLQGDKKSIMLKSGGDAESPRLVIERDRVVDSPPVASRVAKERVIFPDIQYDALTVMQTPRPSCTTMLTIACLIKRDTYQVTRNQSR